VDFLHVRASATLNHTAAAVVCLALLLLLPSPPHHQPPSSLLQTARYLLKGLLAARAGKAPPGGSTGYLARLEQELSSRCPARSMDCWADLGEGRDGTGRAATQLEDCIVCIAVGVLFVNWPVIGAVPPHDVLLLLLLITVAAPVVWLPCCCAWCDRFGAVGSEAPCCPSDSPGG
jgi:hypothetical protein